MLDIVKGAYLNIFTRINYKWEEMMEDYRESVNNIMRSKIIVYSLSNFYFLTNMSQIIVLCQMKSLKFLQQLFFNLGSSS